MSECLKVISCLLYDVFCFGFIGLLALRKNNAMQLANQSMCYISYKIMQTICGFDSSVGRALHRHRRGHGFESRSEPEFFSGLCSSSVTATLAL